MVNRKAGFWIRVLGRLIDLLLLFTIVIASSYLMLERSGGWHFKWNWLFYLWNIELIVLILFFFIFIPLVFNGKTIGMFVVRIKISFKDKNKKIKSIIIRELLFSINWIFMSLLVLVLINHTLIIKFVSTKKDTIKFTNLENLRISIITSIGGVTGILQFIFAISIIVRGEKQGLHDSQSNTETIWINKFTNKEEKPQEIKIKPKPVINNTVIWME